VYPASESQGSCMSDSRTAQAASCVLRLNDSVVVTMCSHRPLESMHTRLKSGCRVFDLPMTHQLFAALGYRSETPCY